MKRLLAIAFLSVLSLSACGSIPLLNGGSIAQSVPAAMVQAEKALAVAHQTYNAVGQELIVAAQFGVLHGSNAALAKTYYDKAGAALKIADSADKAVNAQSIIDAISTANSAMASAKALIGAK